MTLQCLGPYELTDALSAGANGKVYQARDPRTDRRVALKVIDTREGAQRDQVLREARLGASVSHPHLVKVLNVGEEGPLVYLVMELVEGTHLRDHVLLRRLDWRETLRLASQAASAVGAMHARGLLHRDLKPENILVDAQGQVKLVDFGLVHEAGEERPRHGLLGTLHYLAPEQLHAQWGSPGPWSDVYSLGAVLYELLTGRPPFPVRSAAALLEAFRDQAVVPPRELAPELPRPLERVLLRAVALLPRHRYSRMEELARDLDRVREGKPPAGSSLFVRLLDRLLG